MTDNTENTDTADQAATPSAEAPAEAPSSAGLAPAADAGSEAQTAAGHAAEQAAIEDRPLPGDNTIDLRTLIEAGVHFGHQTRRWNPKMRRFIYGSRSGIHIIDLDQTVQLFKRAYDFVSERVARGGHVLFVGTKRQAQEVVASEARRAGMYFITNRWLGGTLTNFRTIKQGLERLRSIERMSEDGVYAQLPKKEVVRLEKERDRLERFLGGLKGMGNLPDVMFVVDPKQESIAIAEARKLEIPVVAITDTNCDPDLIDYPIPGNDDAIRAITVVVQRIADACVDGLGRRKHEEVTQEPVRGHGGPDVQVARYRGGAR